MCVPFAHMLTLVVVEMPSPLITVNLRQSLPILPVAIFGMPEILPGTSPFCFLAQTDSLEQSSAMRDLLALLVSLAFSRNNFLASSHLFTTAMFSK